MLIVCADSPSPHEMVAVSPLAASKKRLRPVARMPLVFTTSQSLPPGERIVSIFGITPESSTFVQLNFVQSLFRS